MRTGIKLFLSILDSLTTSVIAMESSKKREVLEFTINEARYLIDHREAVIGYELLCDNLYEVETELSSQLYQDIADLGVKLGADSFYWLPLKELVIGDH